MLLSKNTINFSNYRNIVVLTGAGVSVASGLPHIVLFGEYLPVKEEWLSKRALRDCDLFIAIGTSGTVSPASQFVRSADYSGARTILINLEPMKPKNPYFKEEYLGLAEELVPILFGNNDGN